MKQFRNRKTKPGADTWATETSAASKVLCSLTNVWRSGFQVIFYHRDICHHWDTFYYCHNLQLLPASSTWRPGITLDIIYESLKPLKQKPVWPQMMPPTSLGLGGQMNSSAKDWFYLRGKCWNFANYPFPQMNPSSHLTIEEGMTWTSCLSEE